MTEIRRLQFPTEDSQWEGFLALLEQVPEVGYIVTGSPYLSSKLLKDGTYEEVFLVWFSFFSPGVIFGVYCNVYAANSEGQWAPVPSAPTFNGIFDEDPMEGMNILTGEKIQVDVRKLTSVSKDMIDSLLRRAGRIYQGLPELTDEERAEEASMFSGWGDLADPEEVTE